MQSDADSVQPGETDGPGEGGHGDTAETDAAEPAGDEAGAPAEAAESGGDEPAKATAKGRPSVFILLTCGFLVCMCCVGVCFTGVTVGVTRTANLEAALRKVGEPAGWKTQDRTVRPWSASVTVSGADSAADVAVWLEGLGEDVSEAEARKCLGKDRGCDAETTVDGFPVAVHYGPADGGAEAKVQIGQL